jgi:hypothetical protein
MIPPKAIDQTSKCELRLTRSTITAPKTPNNKKLTLRTSQLDQSSPKYYRNMIIHLQICMLSQNWEEYIDETQIVKLG